MNGHMFPSSLSSIHISSKDETAQLSSAIYRKLLASTLIAAGLDYRDSGRPPTLLAVLCCQPRDHLPLVSTVVSGVSLGETAATALSR